MGCRILPLSAQLAADRCRDTNLQSLKIGRQSSKIRENMGDRYIHRTDCADGVLVALKRLNNKTILFTVPVSYTHLTLPTIYSV